MKTPDQFSPESKEVIEIKRKLTNAHLEPSFWKRWRGSADGALAMLTDDIYIYPAENNKYGKGYGIRYAGQNFFLTKGSGKGMLVNSNNDRIESKELELLGVTGGVINQQLNELIEKGIRSESEKPWLKG